jgi:hypothetical protein
MRTPRWCVALILTVVISGCADNAQSAQAPMTVVGGDDRNGEYLPVRWMKDNPAVHVNGVNWGYHSDVSAVDPNRVFVATWGDMNADGQAVSAADPNHMVVVLDRDGNVI